LYFCTSVLLYFCTSVLLYFCTSVLLYFRTSILPYFYTSALPSLRTSIPPHFYPSAPLSLRTCLYCTQDERQPVPEPSCRVALRGTPADEAIVSSDIVARAAPCSAGTHDSHDVPLHPTPMSQALPESFKTSARTSGFDDVCNKHKAHRHGNP